MTEPKWKDFADHILKVHKMTAVQGEEKWDNLFDVYRAGFSDACEQFVELLERKKD